MSESKEWVKSTYEMDLPLGFDIVQFSRKSERGENGFWLVKIEEDCGISRYKGVILPEYVRVFIDVISPHQKSKSMQRYLYITTPWYQNLNPRDVAFRAADALGCEKIFCDGKVVL